MSPDGVGGEPEANPSPWDDSTLTARLRERTRCGGPLTFRDWMDAALYDERGGYYQRRGAVR